MIDTSNATSTASATWVESSPTARAAGQIGVKSGVAWGLVGGLCLAAVWSVMYTTPWGTGTGWDQAMYIGAARNLLAGKGLTIAWTADMGKPLTHFPPLYPSVLALLGLPGWDPWDAARYLNAALRGVDLVAVAALAAWAGGSRWSALIAAFVMVASVQMEFVHGSAWSEPLFLVMVLGSLALSVRYLAHGRRAVLVGASVVVACAILTRYVGLTLVPTIALALIWWRKPRDILLFVPIACLPLCAWVVHNARDGGLLVGDRGIAWNSVSAEQLGKALFTVTDWVVPTVIGTRLVSADGTLYAGGALVFLLVGVALGYWLWKQRRWLTQRVAMTEADLLQRMLLVFTVMYVAGVLVSMAVFDDLVEFDTRILAPVFVCLVILFSAAAPRVFEWAWRVTSLRAPVSVAVAAVATAYALRFAALVVSAHGHGVIYSNTDWLGSATMARVRELPADATIFSNAPDAVYILAGRGTYQIPDVGHADAFSPLVQQAVANATGPVVLVYFGDPNIAYRRPVPIQDVQQRLSTRVLADLPDGQVYDVESRT
ncbi:MAG: hypothetical protein JOZ87_26175 [Chloroflexi bacterium]|nr:hypothetical protein [Chloroflexota bacterium]